MGRRVAEASPRARAVFDEASEILGTDVTKIVMEGSEKQLSKTTTTQPAILAVSWAYLAYLRERAESLGRQLRPSAGSGHSFGQFSAAAAADSISFADALELVRERGRIMTKWSKKRPGGMASVIGPSDDDVRDMLEAVSPDGDVGVAAVNAPGQTVISGTLAALTRAIETVRERGARVVQLPISVPGHFPKMAEAREELREKIDAIEFRDPKFPIVSSLTGARTDHGRRSPAGTVGPDDGRDQLDARLPRNAKGRRAGVPRGRAGPRTRQHQQSASTATRASSTSSTTRSGRTSSR